MQQARLVTGTDAEMREALYERNRRRRERSEARQRRIRERALKPRPPLQEAFGRPVGKPKGSWLDDLCALGKAISLCQSCAPKFDYRGHHYYKDRMFHRCAAKCDACRVFDPAGFLFIHERHLVDSDGRSRPGQSWLAT